MTIPPGLNYTPDHEWLKIEGDVATIGITQFAADALGDVVYVDLPPVGAKVSAGDTCGEVESTKSVSDLYAPVGGEIIAINPAVVEDSALINSEPFDGGWLMRVKIFALPDLMDAAAYERLIGK